MESLLSKVIVFLSISGCAGVFVWVPIGAYVTSKWLKETENILEGGPTFYSSGVVFGLQGLLHYATIFFWSFHAKRYGMLEKREQVPKYIQKWFIFAYCWFMASALLFLSGMALFFIYIE